MPTPMAIILRKAENGSAPHSPGLLQSRGVTTMPNLLSVSECARRHGVARSTIHAAIRRGALPARRVGRVWVINEEDCDAFRPLSDPHAKGQKGAAARWRCAKNSGNVHECSSRWEAVSSPDRREEEASQ